MDARICWITQNLRDVPDGEDWLSGKERALAAGLRVPKKRNDWRLGRWTAKRAYCLYRQAPREAMPAMSVLAADDGAPDLYLGESPELVSISISHSHGRGLCAIAPAKLAVGCDLEWVEYESPGFFEEYFAPEETRLCREAPGAVKSAAGYLIWSAKESCLKVIREGLRRDTRSVRISIDFGESGDYWNAWTGHCLETSRVFYGWWRREEEFVCTLASETPNPMPRELRD